VATPPASAVYTTKPATTVDKALAKKTPPKK